MLTSRFSIRRSIPVAAVTCAALLAAGCHSDLPKPESAKYAQFVQAFYVGLAAMQVGNDARADDSLNQATQLAPGEPAAWANWGMLALRQRNYDPAKQRLDRAQSLVGKNGRIAYMLGILESDRGNSAAAITYFRQAAELAPQNPRVQYSLALEIERQGAPDSEAQFEQILQKMQEQRPNNLAVQLELARMAAKRGDTATLHAALDRIAARASSWPADARQRLADLQAAAGGGTPQLAATRSIFLRNVLMQMPDFRSQLAVIHAEPGQEAPPFGVFLRLASPRSQPALPDMEMTFVPEPLPNPGNQEWDWIGAVALDDTHAPVLITANPKTIQLAGGVSYPFPGGSQSTVPTPESVLPVDFNYDFKIDLVLAGAGGLRFLRQDSPQQFTDVTAQTSLPAAILNATYTGAWAADIEADGDLDIVLGAATGLPTVLRNNGDGTFAPIHPFSGVAGLQQFVWADLEGGDGNPDAALIDAEGNLHVFRNDRAGVFREIAMPTAATSVIAMTAADTRHGGNLDLVIVQADGAILRLVNNNGDWTSKEIAEIPESGSSLNRNVRLLAADLDNNGAVDLILASVAPKGLLFDVSGLPGSPDYKKGALIWMGKPDGTFTLMDHASGSERVFAAADLANSGYLDLLGLDGQGHPIKSTNHGTLQYHWQIVHTRAVQATGDQRINSFGVGGEIELRSGLLFQTQPITGPTEHFGLGTWTSTDVARILWPNGTVNAEFQIKSDQELLASQRLKGSCPFLFAWNGHTMQFVKDTVPWGSAIGLRINNLGSARIAATEEWYKIPQQDLAPRDGAYDLRITGELWETYYYDWLQMMTVDHPAGTEVFTDERFVIPPVKLAITATGEPHPIARATDDNGNDVTQILSALDGRYLDTFGRGRYQGITRDHFVEIDLGNDVPADGPLYLIARGWVHPSDSSINVALSQGQHQQPQPLSLEVPDAQGHWIVARPNLGFPAGRNKICLIDLTGVFRPGAPRKLRLRTSLEIYWDQIQWARGLPNTPLHITRIAPSTADLHYRGYSTIHQANASSPEIPDYNRIASTTQIWRDLEGFYTRYGDVRPLLAATDDRYVIMNAGDEISLRFPAPAAPPAGWVRDYVLAGDGWIKDGDYNSTDSATVQPLPYHAKTAYDDPPGVLTSEWVYQHHPEDWLTWQTRYITPQPFRDALNFDLSTPGEATASQ